MLKQRNVNGETSAQTKTRMTQGKRNVAFVIGRTLHRSVGNGREHKAREQSEKTDIRKPRNGMGNHIATKRRIGNVAISRATKQKHTIDVDNPMPPSKPATLNLRTISGLP